MVDFNGIEMIKLLEDYTSDEGRRARRNVVIASALVIGFHLVGLPLYRLPYPNAPEVQPEHVTAALWIWFAVIFFLLVMFIIHAVKDRGIYRERRHIAENKLQELEKYHSKANQPDLLHPGEKLAVKQFKDWKARTSAIRKFGIAIKCIEYALPGVLAVIALWIVSTNLFAAYAGP